MFTTMDKYNAIVVNSDFDLSFVSFYQREQIRLHQLLDAGKINQEQFRELQQEYFTNAYNDYFLTEVECNSESIQLV